VETMMYDIFAMIKIWQESLLEQEHR